MKIRSLVAPLLVSVLALSLVCVLRVLAGDATAARSPHEETVIPSALSSAASAPKSSLDEDCGCNPVAFTTSTTSAPMLNGVSDLVVIQNADTESGSTIPEKKLTLNVSGVCKNKQHAWASASASGYSEAEGPPKITLSGGGKTETGTGSVSMTVDSNADSITFTASASGYTTKTKTVQILQKKARDYTDEIRSRIVQPAVQLMEKIKNIPFVGPAIAGDLNYRFDEVKASGSIEDCCKKGKKINDGTKRASLNAKYGLKTDPFHLSNSWFNIGVKKFGVNISTKLNYTMPGEITGSGAMSGNYKTQSCGGRTCIGLSGNLGGYAGGNLSVTLDNTFVIPFVVNEKSHDGFHGGTVTAPFNIQGNYKECPTNTLRGTIWVKEVRVTLPPLKVTVPDKLQEVIPVKTVTITKKRTTRTLFPRQKIRF